MVVKSIAFVTPETLPMPPVKGGAVEYWINEAARLLPYKEKFIFSSAAGRQPRREDIDGVQYLRYKRGLFGTLLTVSYKLPFKQEHSRFWQFPYSLWCAWRLRGIRPDIIHIHNRPQFVWIIALLNRRSKIVLHLHQVSAIEDSRALWTDALFDAVSLFVGASRFIAQYVRSAFPAVAGKTTHVYNAIDVSQFAVPADRIEPLREAHGFSRKDFIILYAGRLTRAKGCHLLLDALRSLPAVAGERSVKAVMCGGTKYSDATETPYISSLRKIASESGHAVAFTGYVNAADMPAYYALADVVVIPSIVPEGFCFVTIEAIASRKAVIASRCGALPEILSLFKGMRLFECGSVTALSACMGKALVSRPDENDLDHNARVVSEMFSWGAVIEQLTNMYRGIA